MKANQPFILCATDFSPHAAEAASAAAKLASGYGAGLKLVHAVEVTRTAAHPVLQGRLDREVQRVATPNVAVDGVLLKARKPADALLGYIGTERPALVVVGCETKGAIDRWALGSFSEKIAEASPVPTLVVRNPSTFEAWDWTEQRLTILLALDFHASSDVVLRWAKQFALAGPCDLVACHVNWRMPEINESAVASDPPVNPPALQNRLERDLRKKVRDQLGDDSVPIVVRPFFGDPGPCIVDIAAERKAHLIVIGTHQRHGVHRLAQFSVSREVLHQATVNVVCVPVTVRLDPRDIHIPEFRRVLVATDFSDLGNSAIPYACAACGIGGLVKIVHVATRRIPWKRRAKTGWSEDLREKLASLVPAETGARCQPPLVEVLENGDVAKAICAEAERFGADVVCLASHGLGASRALHGSVTKAVLKHLRRPLLIVRRRE
jgi:nucleotide-binding universal stress UspA family protein